MSLPGPGDLVRRIVSLGFDEAAVAVVETQRTMVKIANSQPSVVQSWREVYIDLYLARDKRILVTSLTTESGEEVLSEVRRALENIGSVEPSFIYSRLPDPDPGAAPLGGLVKRSVERFLEDPGETASLLVAKAHEEGAERVAGTLDGFVRKRCLATSTGFDKCEESTGFTVYLRAFIGEASGHWGYGGSGFDKRDIEEVASRAVYFARESSRRGVDLGPGRYDVILSPLVVGNFLDYISMALSGLNKITGVSFFARHEPGAVVASELLTIRDSPHRDDMIDATGFDDEGQATRENILIGRGRLETFLHNTKTAAVLGTRTTGNAGWISPRPWNLVVSPGDYDEEEMIRSVKRGLLVNNNWYTRYQNVVEGQFSTVTRDALLVIENGEIVGSVKRMRIADSFPNILRNIAGLGKRVYKAKWWEIRRSVETPFILVRDVGVTRPT